MVLLPRGHRRIWHFPRLRRRPTLTLCYSYAYCTVSVIADGIQNRRGRAARRAGTGDKTTRTVRTAQSNQPGVSTFSATRVSAGSPPGARPAGTDELQRKHCAKMENVPAIHLRRLSHRRRACSKWATFVKRLSADARGADYTPISASQSVNDIQLPPRVTFGDPV